LLGREGLRLKDEPNRCAQRQNGARGEEQDDMAKAMLECSSPASPLRCTTGCYGTELADGPAAADGGRYRAYLPFWGHNERASIYARQTMGQTARFRQTAPETWCQSRVCLAY